MRWIFLRPSGGYMHSMSARLQLPQCGFAVSHRIFRRRHDMQAIEALRRFPDGSFRFIVSPVLMDLDT